MTGPSVARCGESEAAVEVRFREGVAHARDGDYDAALRSFVQAYAIKPTPRLLYNMAVCEERLERWLDAVKHYQAVVDDPSTHEEDRADARAHVSALESKLGRIDIHAVDGAAIAIDDGPVIATAPLARPLLVTPGHHVVVIRLPSGEQAAPIEPRAGETVELDVAAPKHPEAPPRVDQARVVEMPPPPTRVGAPVARIAVAGTLGALGVAAGVAAGVVGARSAAESSRANRLRGQLSSAGAGGSDFCAGVSSAACSELAADNRSASSDKTAAIALGIGAGALLGAGLATWFLWPRPDRAPIAVIPVLDRDQTGAEVTFSF